VSLSSVERRLRTVFGLNTGVVGRPMLERAVSRRIEDTEADGVEDYERLLRVSASELQALVEEVVVPETWFFRDRVPFDVLARFVARPPWEVAGSTIRMLSLACSTGEEPYSMAMAALAAGWPRQRVTVLGLDVSERAITAARRGVYRSHAFRSGPLDFRDEHFERVEDGWSIAPTLRQVVSFRRVNALDANQLRSLPPQDVVFCRNLLIYMTTSARQAILSTLHLVLRPGGLLVVGHAEAGLVPEGLFVSERQPMAFAFRKAEPGTERRRRSTGPIPAIRRARSIGESAVTPPPPAPEPAFRPSLTALLQMARVRADEGRFAEAVSLCERALQEHGASAAAYHLLGIVRDAMGDAPLAVNELRRAIYLEPEHAEALLHLAGLLERVGADDEAARLRRRAERAHARRRTGEEAS
jgi:chemotaxis protein methyltransferase WspC